MTPRIVQAVTVAAGQTDSAEIIAPDLNVSGQVNPGDANVLEIFAPAALAEVATITAAPTSGGTYRALQSGGSDLTIGAGKALLLSPIPDFLKIHLGGAAADARTFSLAWKRG